MTPTEIKELIIAIVGLIPTLVSVIALIVNIIKNKDWKLIMSMADTAMTVVEKYSIDHPSMTSEQKLDMALEAVKESMAVANIKVTPAKIKRVIEYIKQSIDWFNGMK